MTKIATIFFLFLINNAFSDGIPHPWQTGFQEAASPVMEVFEGFYNELFIIITIISLFVLGLLVYVCLKFRRSANPEPNRFSHNLKLEIIWTIIPVLIVLYIAIPSFKSIYMSDVLPETEMTLKVVGHQWYWEYIYPDHENMKFDSYYIKDADLKPGQKRLLDVDNQVVVPVDTNIKVLTTSADVIHAWAVPAFGIKMDSIPGRTNETWFKANKIGIYYGQCSQLCGFGHGFMPIAVKVVSKEEFKIWIEEAKKKFAQENYGKDLALSSN